MNRATRRMMKSKEAKTAIRGIAGDNKHKRKQTEDLFSANFDFSLQYYELGKQHKAEGRTPQNMEQFMYFNNLHEFDFAKEGVPESEKKKMTEEWVKLVVYPAYINGYDNVPIFPSDRDKVLKSEMKKIAGKDKAMYENMSGLVSDIQNDKEMLHQEGMRDSITGIPLLTRIEFLERHNELDNSNLPDGFPIDHFTQLVYMLYDAYCGGYKKAEQIPSDERIILKIGQELCDMEYLTDFYSIVDKFMGTYNKENALYVFQQFQSVIPDVFKDKILVNIEQS